MNTNKFLIFTLLNFITLNTFSYIDDSSITFAFFYTPKIQQFNKEIWQKIKDKVDGANKLQSDTDFNQEILNHTIDTIQQIHRLVEQNKSDMSHWTLINIEPEEHAQKLQCDCYCYLKLVMNKENYSEELWQQLNEQTEQLVIFCQSTESNEENYQHILLEMKKICVHSIKK